MQKTITTLSILAALVTVGCASDAPQDDPNNANRGVADYFDECVDGCLADRGLTEAECELACEDSEDGETEPASTTITPTASASELERNASRT